MSLADADALVAVLALLLIAYYLRQGVKHMSDLSDAFGGFKTAFDKTAADVQRLVDDYVKLGGNLNDAKAVTDGLKAATEALNAIDNSIVAADPPPGQ